ncbi:sugar-binding transcriptional regulator [Domibacillus enclensis]|uniref:Transcriptional regulator n=1 Tax=Domibacillus enclensis TaxID=1017273 RepID=A0A1N6ZN03_9BACI|nr:sugar-binding transcriptional regulator [Domibacillus enclensis]OXS76751.1 transcriptional regulator [Domibacillus enclensis]SIR28273.1 DNA-binding transcriptional regulator LsrR, DeoR family [Domibacillus enclensis]
MLSWEERRQLVKIANLYYTEGWTQQQIAKKVGVSRPVISKMLQKAKDAGIVEVYIKDESVHTVELEKRLEEKFHLHDTVVVPSTGFTPDMVRRAVGQAAAHYLSRHLKPDVERLGISWGTTLSEVVKEYPFERREKVNIVPLVGGMGTKSVEIHANQLAYELAKKMNGTCSYLYAPAIVETEELTERLVQMQDIAQVLEEGKNVEVALIGIGNPHKGSTMKDIGYLHESDIQSLKKAGAIGDIGSRFYDQEGTPIEHELNKRIIGLRLRDLKKVPYVIGIAEGTYKAESIEAALKGGYIHTLVIDEQTALALLT